MLVILGGLPGAGKTTLARAIAQRVGAVLLRIDSIEAALREAGAVTGEMGPVGYRVAHCLAAENLSVGATVVADSVNPIEETRAAWRSVATMRGCDFLEVEVVCSDVDEHRRRVETRVADMPGLRVPSWEQVLAREFEPWRGALVVDTATVSADEHARRIASRLDQ